MTDRWPIYSPLSRLLSKYLRSWSTHLQEKEMLVFQIHRRHQCIEVRCQISLIVNTYDNCYFIIASTRAIVGGIMLALTENVFIALAGYTRDDFFTGWIAIEDVCLCPWLSVAKTQLFTNNLKVMQSSQEMDLLLPTHHEPSQSSSECFFSCSYTNLLHSGSKPGIFPDLVTLCSK